MQTMPARLALLPSTSPLPSTLPMAYTPAPTTAHLQTKGGTKSDYFKYLPELVSAGATIASMIATGTENFNKVPVPQPNRVTAEKQFLERTDDRASIERNKAAYARAIEQGLAMGQGPGASSMAQEAYMNKVRADEAAMQRVNEINAKIDASEKAMNLEAAMKAQVFNEENLRESRERAFTQNTAAERFGRERNRALMDQFTSGAQAIGTIAENRRLAEAYSGDSEVLERMLKDGTLAKLLKLT